MARGGSTRWQDRAHFFAVASTIMRQILVDHARSRAAAKRGGSEITVVLDDAAALPQTNSLDLLALDRAMRRLESLDARQCQIVELRFFGGLSIEETAQIVDISPATTKREWATARVWLHRALSAGAEP
jgi:RNA polymerase sigma factor (TIGR02999 family)